MRILQEEGTGDAQSDDTLGGRRSEEDALGIMILPVRDPFLTQEDATLPPAHEDQEESAVIDNHRDEEEAVEPLTEPHHEQAHDVAPQTDNVRCSDRLGSWVYF